MKIRKNEIIIVFFLVALFIATAFIYPSLPERVASHWNADGVVDGYMPKFWGTFLMPLMMLVIAIIFFVIPRVDPKKENIEKFRPSFDEFLYALFGFFAYIHALTLAWNSGYQFEFLLFLIPALGILFIFTGRLISRAEPNWTIGIRTPWTLSSDSVWKKTHTLAGKLFIASGIVMFLGVMLPSFAMWFVLIPILLSATISAIYSYFLYRAETRTRL